MIRITVKKNEFAKVAATVPARAAAAVATTSLAINEGAKRRSRVETGTMRRGWQVQFETPTRAVVGNPVPYAIYHEFGTAHMAAQPMLTPEVEMARAKFEALLRAIFKV